MHVLLVSTSLGAGHDGVARTMARRIAERGHQATVVDYLDLLAFRTGGVVERYYRAQLRYAPWTYERSYATFDAIRPRFAAVNAAFARGNLRRVVQRSGIDAIVVNNPHAALALGHLREARRLTVPVTTYATDFGVHALWVHPGIDRTLVLGAIPLEEARSHGAKSVEIVRPVVDERFTTASREHHDHGAELRILITAGSWGVGSITDTLRDVSSVPGTRAVVVCGRDTSLRARLERSTSAEVLGWVDDMPALMRTCDVLVENAGGLTSLEALATGLPVVSYRALVGHGRHNARNLAASGLSTYATSAEQLVDVLGHRTFVRPAPDAWADAPDAVEAVLATAGERRP